MAYQEFTGELDQPTSFIQFDGELDTAEASVAPVQSMAEAPDVEVVTSARAWRGAGAGRGNGVDARRLDLLKNESVLQGRVLDEPAFNPDEANRLSNRKYAEGRQDALNALSDARSRAPSVSAVKAPLIPFREDGVFSRASDLVGSQLDSYSAGLGYKLGDAANALGATDVGGSLRERGAALQGRSDLTNKSVALNANGAFEKYAPQVLAVFPTMAVAAATGGGSLVGSGAAMFGIAEFQSYAEGRKAGLTPLVALERAVPMGGAEVLGEYLGGTGKLLKALEWAAIKGGSKEALKELSGKLLAGGLKEVPSEELTYGLQFGIDKSDLGLKPDATLADFKQGAIDTAIVAAGSGGVMAGGGKAVSVGSQLYNTPQRQAARELSSALTGGEFAPMDVSLANPNPNLVSANPLLTPVSKRTREVVQAEIPLATSVDEATAAFVEATNVSTPIVGTATSDAPTVYTPTGEADVSLPNVSGAVATSADPSGGDLASAGVGNAGLDTAINQLDNGVAGRDVAPVAAAELVSQPGAQPTADLTVPSALVKPVQQTSDASLLARVPVEVDPLAPTSIATQTPALLATSPTIADERAQKVSSMQLALSELEPFSEEHTALIASLEPEVTAQAVASVEAGVMPVYSSGNGNFVAISPSAQNPGQWQVSRYAKDGITGDSQYASIEQAVTQEGLATSPRLPEAQAQAVLQGAMVAEGKFQAGKTAGAGGVTSTLQLPEITDVGNQTTPMRDGATVENTGAGSLGNGIQTVTGGLPSLVDPAGRTVSSSLKQRLGDAAAARTSAQADLDHWHNQDPVTYPKVTMGEPTEAEHTQVYDAIQRTKELFGVSADVIPFSDPSPDSVNGIEIGGKVYINTRGLTSNALNTGWHETHHVMQGRAEADTRAGRTNTPAQRYVEKVDAIFDTMGEQGKLNYIANFLHAQEVNQSQPVQAFIKTLPINKKYWSETQKAKLQTIKLEAARDYLSKPLTKREMMADFVGNRATDRGFIRSLAKADPKNFGQWAKQWLQTIHSLLADLRGNRGNTESKAVDSYVANLEQAKLTLQGALIELRASGAISKDAYTEAMSKPTDPVQFARKGVIGEVAPHPGDTPMREVDGVMVAKTRAEMTPNEKAMDDKREYAQTWNATTDSEKTQANRNVASKLFQQLMDLKKLRGWSISFSTGQYQGTVNPNFIIDAPESATQAQMDDVAREIGYILDQQSMVVFDEDNTSGGNQASFIKLVLPDGFPESKLRELRGLVKEQFPRADSNTQIKPNELTFGNFTAFNGDAALDDSEFRAGIRAVVESLPWDGAGIEVMDIQRFESQLVWPDRRGNYFKEGEYGESNRREVQPGDSRAVLRNDKRNRLLELRRIARESVGRRGDWIDASTSGRERSAERRKLAAEDSARAGSQRSGTVEHGTASPNSTNALGQHFSQKKRSSLSSVYYGTGMKGLESGRLSGAADIKPRIFFYVDSGQGVTPESGVGSVKHLVKLNNLYDANKDPLGFIKNTKGENVNARMNAWERLIMNAGFDGYLADTGANQNFAVLVGKHDIQFQRRQAITDIDQINDLGSFNLDANDEVDESGFADLGEEYLSNSQPSSLSMQEQLQAELAAEQAAFQAKMVARAKAATLTGPRDVTVAQMQAKGLFPEQAMPFGEAVEDNGSIQINLPVGYPNRGAHELEESGFGWAGSAPYTFTAMDRSMTKEGAIKFVKAQMARVSIQDSGFDLASAYRKSTVLKLAQTWQALAGKPGLFKLPDSATALDFSGVAAQLKAMSGYDISTKIHGPDLTIVDFKRKSDGYVFSSSIESRSDDTFQVCTMSLAGSGDLGSQFYAVTAEWARLNGKQFRSSPTLSSINTTRRTEQVLSYALKTGNTGVILPGGQNRVYGYNIKPVSKEDHDLNLARLLLAGLRNVVEVDPEVRRLSYNPSTDLFTTKNGGDATEIVAAFLRSKDARAYGMGRTTLARAVLTSQIITGGFDDSAVTEFKAPIAYSRKQNEGDVLSEAWGEQGAVNPALTKYLGDSVMQQDDGTPIVMYHGTARDISEFRAKQAGAIFLTSSPVFADEFAGFSAEWMARHYDQVLAPEQVETAKAAAIKTIMGDKSMKLSERKAMAAEITSGKPTGAAQDVMNEAAAALMPSGPNIVPVVVRAEHPFDYKSKSQIEDLMFTMLDIQGVDDIEAEIAGSAKVKDVARGEEIEMLLRAGAWEVIESPQVQEALKALGHDSFWVVENGQRNLAVFEPTQIKSVFNNGDYSLDDPRISFSRKQLDGYIDQRNKSMKLVSPQSVQDADIGLAVKAIEAATSELADGSKESLPVPIGRLAHVLTMLRIQPQMMRVDTSILKKVFLEKHAGEFGGITPDALVKAMYQPAMILKGVIADEFIIVTSLITPKGPVIIPVLTNTTARGTNIRSAAVQSIYGRKVSIGGDSILQRIKDGALLYADPEQAQVAITGRGTVPLVGINAGEAQFSQAPPTKGQVGNVSDAESSVKPLNHFYAGWASAKDIILEGIASKKVKSDTDLVKWIGNNYKAANSPNGWEDAPSFSRKQPMVRAPGLPGESKFMAFRRVMQDQFIQINELQNMLTARGGVVGEAQDVYRAEERMHGRAQELLKDFSRHQIEPLIAKTAKFGIGLDELSLYAYAMHAKERNAYIESINPSIGDAGSGMSNVEADNIIQLAHLSGDQAKFDELQQDLMGITSTTRRVLLDEGLITQEEHDGWDGLYENYVPLRGFENVTPEGNPRPGVSRGFSTTGKESIKALGRRSKAGDIIENIIRDYERAVIRSEKNSVAKTFLDLALSNPDPALWEVQPVKLNRSFNKASGMVLMNSANDTGEETIAIKVAGQQVRVKINDPLILRAMKLASKDETSQLERLLANTLGMYTNLMRNTLTRYNPIFGAINLVRDGQMGAVSIYDELGAEGAKLYAKYFTPALAASFRSERDKADPANRVMDRYMQEMRFAGGSTGGYHMRETSEITDAMRGMMLAAGATPNTKMEALRGSKAYQGAAHAMKWLEIIGSTSEDAARVAAYRAAREMGKTPAQAASISKNLTTNFNRKGEWGTTLNSLFLFFNAGVQGSTRVLQALNKPRVRKLAAGMTAVGMMIALANAGAGDDDDGQAYWDKIPDFEKERNLIFMLPPGVEMEGAKQVGTRGRYIKIPMPYGINVFPVIGNQLADMARYAKDSSRGTKPVKAGINIASAIFGSINPFGGSVDVTKPVELGMAVAPTVVDMGIQLAAGVNAFGRPVGPEKSPFDDKPDSENFSARQAGSAAQYAARWINSVTGGNQGRSGAIDLQPGTLDNIVRNTTGGLGVFLADTFVNLPAKVMSPVETTSRDMPLLRNFYGQIDGVTDMGLFYDRRAEVTKEYDAAKREMKLGIEVDYSEESMAKMNVAKAAESYTEWMTKLRKKEIEIAGDDDLTSSEKKVQRHELEVQRGELARSFNSTYNETMKAVK